MGDSVSIHYTLLLMPKALLLCTGAESNLEERVLDEVEKNSFIVLPGKAGHSSLLPFKKLCDPTQESLVRSFIAMFQRWSC